MTPWSPTRQSLPRTENAGEEESFEGEEQFGSDQDFAETEQY